MNGDILSCSNVANRGVFFLRQEGPKSKINLIHHHDLRCDFPPPQATTPDRFHSLRVRARRI